MRAFDSIAKKLAIPMVVLFEIGWIIYTGGFGSFMHQQVLENTDRLDSRYSIYDQQSASDAHEVLRNPILFSHYFALVGGQFVAVLFLIHAALPLNTASYVVGVLSSILNVIYFVSVGYLITWSVIGVRFYEDRINTLQESPYSSYSPYSDSSSEARARLYLHAVRCVLAGTIIMTISWGIIQLLTFFYKPPQNKTDLWQVVREFARNLSTSTSQVKAKLGELIRLSTIPLLILSAIGWAVCTAGLYRLYDSTSSSSITIHQYDFGTWATFFVTPLLYFATLFHAGCSGGASTMSGVFAAIFNVFFVLQMGSIVVRVCIAKYSLDQLNSTSTSTYSEAILQEIHNYNLILGGGVVCLLFWTIVHTAWLFYCFDRSANHDRLQSNGDAEHSQPIIAHAQQNEYGPGDTTTTHSSFVPGQQVPPPYAKHLQPVLVAN